MCYLCNHDHPFGGKCIHDDYNSPLSSLLNFPKPEPILPPYEPPTFNLNTYIKPDPIIPPYEPPTINLNLFSKPDPILPLPPDPVYDLSRNLVGWKSDQDNFINIGNGLRLDIDPGGSVRSPLDNIVGHMGPLNTMMPPSFPDLPDYGPPQSDMEAWDPGYSPLDPF
jgi:hypothetical protein